MTHREFARRLQMERLDSRIAMNADGYPYAPIQFDGMRSDAPPTTLFEFSSQRILSKRPIVEAEGEEARFPSLPSGQPGSPEGESQSPSANHTGTISSGTISAVHGSKESTVSPPPVSLPNLPPVVLPVIFVAQGSSVAQSNPTPTSSGATSKPDASKTESPSSDAARTQNLSSFKAPLVSASNIAATDRAFAAPVATSGGTWSSPWNASSYLPTSSSRTTSDPSSANTHAIVRRVESTKTNGDGTVDIRLRGDHHEKGATSIATLRSNREQSNAVRDSLAQETTRRSVTNRNFDRLPMPDGMIEIVDDRGMLVARRACEPSLAMASNNPFEVLQLFVGSSNMIHSNGQPAAASMASLSMGSLTQSDDASGMVSNDDLWTMVATGVAFAIVLRYSRIQPAQDDFLIRTQLLARARVLASHR